METIKFIIVNYGPTIVAVGLMIYLCFFTNKNMNGNEQKLKESICTLIRENAELKVELKKCYKVIDEQIQKATDKIHELEEQLDGLIKESEANEPNNEEPKE